MTEQQKQAVEESAEKYVKALRGMISPREISNIKADFNEGAEEVINNPSKYGLQPINEWVSVKDLLPAVGEEFNLIQDIQDGLGDPVSTCGEWNAIAKRFEYIGTDVEISNVTHWQPLPSPPKTTKPL